MLGATLCTACSLRNTRVTKGGFTPRKKYLFRYAYQLRKGGKSAWSEPPVEFVAK